MEAVKITQDLTNQQSDKLTLIYLMNLKLSILKLFFIGSSSRAQGSQDPAFPWESGCVWTPLKDCLLILDRPT